MATGESNEEKCPIEGLVTAWNAIPLAPSTQAFDLPNLANMLQKLQVTEPSCIRMFTLRDAMERHRRELPATIGHYAGVLGLQQVAPGEELAKKLLLLEMTLGTRDANCLLNELGTQYAGDIYQAKRTSETSDQQLILEHSDLMPELRGELSRLTQLDTAKLHTPGGMLSDNLQSVSGVGKRSVALMPQQRIGDYVVQRLLGKGGMGEVWLAQDLVLGRDVAIKFVPNSGSNSSSASRSLREARAAASLNHPNVVTVHHVLEHAGELQIVMELLEGSLAEELKGHGSLPWREATQAIRDAAAGLVAAHVAGIIHRDIKPSNLLRTRRHTVKVVDFGLAKEARISADRTDPGTVLGTPAFMCPEQCNGRGVDARSDIYSLTATYYMLLTRRFPFEAETATAIMYQHCHEPFPDARRFVPDLPDSVYRILSIGSQKDPNERFPSAAAMLEALDVALSSPEKSHTFGELTPEEMTPEEARLPSLAPAPIRGPVSGAPSLNEQRPTFAVQKTINTQPTLDDSRLTPLVGRDLQLAMIVDRWQYAKNGSGQAVLISGEAGIGKSRIVRAFQKQIESENHVWRQCFGSPFAQNSAFRPFIELLEKSLQFGPQEPAESKLRKIEEFFVSHELPSVPSVPLLADMLSVSCAGRYAPLGLSPGGQKRKTTELLLYLLPQMARHQPVVFVIEDLQWLDSSSIELIGLLIDQIPTIALLVLMTARPEFEPPWPFRAYLSLLTLDRLTADFADKMIRSCESAGSLPPVWRKIIAEKADGVPLFVEELARTVAEMGVTELPPASSPAAGLKLSIPETLSEMLMARLDRLATIREVIEIAAVIGREFRYELLRKIVPVSDKVLVKELDKLLKAGLLYQRGLFPQTVYIFKHALIQEAVYQSASKRRREMYHARIAETLGTQFADLAANQAELVAQHFTEGGEIQKAIDWWFRAATRAVERSANVEAISHCKLGLASIAKLPEGVQKIQLELMFRSAMGVPLISIKGYAAPDVEACYQRAFEICQQLGAARELAMALFGLFQFYVGRAMYDRAFRIGEQLRQVALEADSPNTTVLAETTIGIAHFYTGGFAPAKAHLQKALQEPEESVYSPMLAHAQDMIVAAHCWSAWISAISGLQDKALKQVSLGIKRAVELGHPHTRALADHFLLMVYHLRRDVPAMLEAVLPQLELTREQQFPVWLSGALAFHGWAVTEQGSFEEGITLLIQGANSWAATGEDLGASLFRTMIADALRKAGRLLEARDMIHSALDFVLLTNERFYEPEVRRVQGEIAIGERNDMEAEQCFADSIASAKSMGSGLFELRTATSQARLWRRMNRGDLAAKNLEEICERISEGRGLPDFCEAQAILEEIRQGHPA